MRGIVRGRANVHAVSDTAGNADGYTSAGHADAVPHRDPKDDV